MPTCNCLWEKHKLLLTVCWITVNVTVKTFHCLRVVVVFQALGAKPLLEGKVSEQLDVGLCNFPPALLFLHHLFQTTEDTQTQFLQCLYIWRKHMNSTRINTSASVLPRQQASPINRLIACAHHQHLLSKAKYLELYLQFQGTFSVGDMQLMVCKNIR